MMDFTQKFLLLLLVSLVQSAPNLNYLNSQPQIAYSLVPQTFSYNTVNGLGNVFALPPPVPPQVIPATSLTSQVHFQNDDLKLAEYIYGQLNEFTNAFQPDPNNISPPIVSNHLTANSPAPYSVVETQNPVTTPNTLGNIRITYHGDTGTSTQYVSPHSAISGASSAVSSHFQSQNYVQQQQQQNKTRWEHHSAIVLANPTPPATSAAGPAHQYQAPRAQTSGSDPYFELLPSMLAPEESKRLEASLNAATPGHSNLASVTEQAQQSAMHQPNSYGHAILPPIRYDDNSHSVEYYPMGTHSGHDRLTLGGNSGSNPSVYYKSSNSISYPSMILKNSDNVAIHYPSLQVGGGKEPSFEHNAYAAALMTGVQWQNQDNVAKSGLKKSQVYPRNQYNQVQQVRANHPIPSTNSTKQENRPVKTQQNPVSSYSFKDATTEPNGQIMKSIGYEVMTSSDPSQKYRYSGGYDGKRHVQEKKTFKHYTSWQPMNSTKTRRVNETVIGIKKPGESPRPPKMLNNSGKQNYQQFSESRPRPSVTYRQTHGKPKALHRLRGHSGHRLTESKKRKRHGFTQNIARYIQKFRSMHARNFNRQNMSMKKLQQFWSPMGRRSKQAETKHTY